MRILALLVISVLMPFVNAATISVTPSTNTATVGDTVTADVNILDVVDLYAFQFDLSFSPNVIAASGVHNRHFFDMDGFFAGFIDNATGTITFISDTLSGPAFGKSGSGTLAQIHFTVTGPGTSSLMITNPILLDSTLASLPVQLVSSEITISDDASQVPEPATGFIAGAVLIGISSFRFRACRSLCTKWKYRLDLNLHFLHRYYPTLERHWNP
jgi:hypothetical protein